MKHFIISAVTILLLCCCKSHTTYLTMTGMAQGGEYHITFSDSDSEGRKIPQEMIISATDSILTLVENTFSGYNKFSVLSDFNKSDGNFRVPALFCDLYSICITLWKETGGLFDISAAPLFDFWGFGFKDPAKMAELRSKSDTPSVIDSLLNFCGMQHLSLSCPEGENPVLHKDDPRVRLNFNAVAQGYTCDLVAREFEAMGIANYLIDVGMEIRCKGVNASGKKWRIGIDAPIDGNMTAGADIRDIVEVSDCGIVTSGNYRKFFIGEDGEKYAHSINPISGWPARDTLLSATVIAPDATMADAYATYCMVLGYEKAVEFLESRNDLNGYLITPHTTYKKL